MPKTISHRILTYYIISLLSTALWMLTFIWAIAGDPTPLAPHKPIHPYATYRGLEFDTSKAYIPSDAEIKRVRQHAIEVLGLDNSYVKKGGTHANSQSD